MARSEVHDDASWCVVFADEYRGKNEWWLLNLEVFLDNIISRGDGSRFERSLCCESDSFFRDHGRYDDSLHDQWHRPRPMTKDEICDGMNHTDTTKDVKEDNT